MKNYPQDIAVQLPDANLWLEKYGDALFRYALRRLHNTAEAEDVLQETLLAALQARTSFSGRSSEKTWLTGILKHKIIDLIRKRVRESTVEDINALSDAAAQQDVDALFDSRSRWIQSPKDWGDPDKTLHTHQFIEHLEHCLQRLKPIHAQIFSLKELLGQSIDEICKELDITATNCSVILYRARMSLRGCLEARRVIGDQEENL